MKKLMLIIVAFIFSMTMTLSSGFAEGDSMSSEDKVKEEKAVKGDAQGKKLGHKKINGHPHGGPKGKALGHDKRNHEGGKSGKLEKERDEGENEAVEKKPEGRDPRDRRHMPGDIDKEKEVKKEEAMKDENAKDTGVVKKKPGFNSAGTPGYKGIEAKKEAAGTKKDTAVKEDKTRDAGAIKKKPGVIRP
jgi:hypothetical protein